MAHYTKSLWAQPANEFTAIWLVKAMIKHDACYKVVNDNHNGKWLIPTQHLMNWNRRIVNNNTTQNQDFSCIMFLHNLIQSKTTNSWNPIQELIFTENGRKNISSQEMLQHGTLFLACNNTSHQNQKWILPFISRRNALVLSMIASN